MYLNRLGGQRGVCKVRERSGEENIKERGVLCVEEVMWETGLVKNISNR